MVLAHNINEKQRTKDIQISVDVTFDSMLLSNKTLEGLKSSGFFKPSPIQLHGIPLGKCGFDLFLEAKSGTGKTAVFTVITLEKINLEKGLQSVILAPTREIAAQICDVIKQIGSCYKDLNVEVVMGGLSIEKDIEKLKHNVHVLVGSPGRMRHLIQDKHVEVSAVRLLVLDEADKLMDKSFQSDINYIFSVLPNEKQVIMSSATYPVSLKSIMQNYVQQAQHICLDSTSILLGIKQFISTVSSNINIVTQTKNKFNELLKILSNQEFKQCLIFCNYQVRVGELCKMLLREKWPAERLHGQLEQTDRLDALKTLQEYKCRILVSTDLAARGIDASNVDLVINFEPPYDWQTYLHRIGRAGRFGSYGIAITILSEGKEVLKFKEMVKSINSSVDFNYLWSDDKFVIDDSITSCPSFEKPIQENQKSIKIEVQSKDKFSTTSEMHDPHSIVENTEKSPAQEEHTTLTGKNDKESEAQEISQSKLEDISPTTELKEIDIEVPEDIDFEDTSKYVNNGKNILSFDQLLHSFEKAKASEFNVITNFIDDKPNHYENNDIIDESLRNYLNSLLGTENDPCIILCSNSDMELEVDSVTIHNGSNTNIGEIEIPNDIINVDKQFPKPITREKEVYLDEPSSIKALRNAGLPTSFCSTKPSNQNQLNKANMFQVHQNNTKTKIKANVIDKLKIKNQCKQTKRKVISQTHLKHDGAVSPITVNDDCYTNSYLFSRSTKYVSSQNKDSHSSSSRHNFLNTFNDISFNSTEHNCDIYKTYRCWYKSFKSHIKQVELSLYMDELSNL